MPSGKDYWKNPEKYRKKSNEYFHANRDLCLTKMSERNRINPKPNRDRVKKWSKEHPVQVRRHRIDGRRRKNGFSVELFTSLLTQQRGLCAICNVVLEVGLTSKAACADHCHATNRPRGILCKRCNMMLGHARDSKIILQRSIEYLQQWEISNAPVA